MNETEEDLIIKASKLIHSKDKRDEHKDLMRVATALDVQEAGPWRSPEEVDLWVKDFYEMRENQGLDAEAASEFANVRELKRISAKVDGALNEQALQSCILKKVAIYGKNHDQAVLECENGFQADHTRYGQKPHESETLRQLTETERQLRHEIIGFEHNFKTLQTQTPNEAEISARRKLGLPQIVTLTKDEEPKKDNRVFLDHVPSMYLKSKEEIQKEAQKERRENDRLGC